MVLRIENMTDGARRRILSDGQVYVGYMGCVTCSGDGYYRTKYSTSSDADTNGEHKVQCPTCMQKFDPLALKKREMRLIARAINRLHRMCWENNYLLDSDKFMLHSQIVLFGNIAAEVKKQVRPTVKYTEVIGG